MADSANKPPAPKQEVIPPARPAPQPSLREEINRLFDEFDRGFPSLIGPRALFGGDMLHRPRMHMPAVDVAETETAFEISAELPGMTEADIAVEVVNGDLRIKGEKKEEKEQKQKDYYLSERRFGSFERRLRIPEGVDPAKIEAAFSHGVLKVTLPKTPAAAPKRVEVKSK